MVLPIVAGLGSLALRALPYAVRGARAVVNPRNIKNYFIGARSRPIQGPVNVRTFRFDPNKKGLEALGMGGGITPGILRPTFTNIAGQSAVLGGAGLAYDALTDSAEQSTEPPAGSGGPADTVPQPVDPKKKEETTDRQNFL